MQAPKQDILWIILAGYLENAIKQSFRFWFASIFSLAILAFLLVDCTSQARVTKEQSPTLASQDPTEAAMLRTKLFAITAEAETQIAGYPRNDATVTAIMASKSAGGTSAAATMTAQPSETPAPTIPPDSPLCRPADLKTDFGSNAATQQILLGAGLTNISGAPCFLQTWPQVMLVDQQGQPLDVDYSYFELGTPYATIATQQAQEPVSATARLGLLPGWAAWVNLDWQNWCRAPVSGGAVIRLTLLDNAGVIDIPTNIGAGGPCNAPGYSSSVGIVKLEPVPPQ